jgi:RNA polymerase sigma-70 factor (ECF subfamily)
VIEHPLEEDRALLDGFRRGDKRALAEVYRRYVAEVTMVIRGGARDAWELENLIQETFVRAFQPRARSSYDGVRPFAAWIATIARNLTRDAGRARGREAKRTTPLVHDPAGGPSPERAALDGELARVVTGFVAELDDEDRAIFVARYERGLSLRAAAKDLGTPVFGLRKRDALLRERLLSSLRAAGYLEDTHVKIGVAALRRRGKS